MSKKKRVYVQRLSLDEINSMSDDELRDKHMHFYRVLENNHSWHSDGEREAWETELAYVAREIDIRQTRYSMHDQYIRSIREQEREFEREEATLPVVNFDNFVPGRHNV